MKPSSDSYSDSSSPKTSDANSKGLAETLFLPFFDEADLFGMLKAPRVNSLGEEMGRRQLGPQGDVSALSTVAKK